MPTLAKEFSNLSDHVILVFIGKGVVHRKAQCLRIIFVHIRQRYFPVFAFVKGLSIDRDIVNLAENIFVFQKVIKLFAPFRLQNIEMIGMAH